MKKLVMCVLFISIAQISTSQIKFGKISEEDLVSTYYEKDSSANAVFLNKNRKSYYSYNAAGVTLITDHHVRIKIYNKEGLDWATVTQGLAVSNSSEEKFMGLKASTYNLVDGKTEITKLSKKEVFKENITDYFKQAKFTMPNVQPGSIIEYKYRVSSPFFYNIDPVVGQYEIPIKKLDISIALLEYFTFSKKSKGYYHLNVETSKKRNISLETSDDLVTINQDYIPAIKEEAYVNNIDNYTAGLLFEITQFIIPGSIFENYATSWSDVAKNIYDSSSFGGEIGKLRFLKEEIDALKTTLTTDNEKIVGAYQYVKSKIKWNGNYRKYSSKGIKEAVKEGSGSSADINLMLVGVLRELGMKVNPVLVSTRSNGTVLFPTEEGFNYVTAGVELEKGVLVLDATEKYGVPGVLPLRVINGDGRLVRENRTSTWVNLSNAQPSKINANLNVKINEDGTVEGMSRTTHSNYAALSYRDDHLNVNEDDLIASLEAKNNDIMIGDFKIQNKTELFKPVTEMFKFEGEDMVEVLGDQMMFKPLFFKALTENPFKLDERMYPVDFGTPFEIKNRIGISIPEGFEIVSVTETLAI